MKKVLIAALLILTVCTAAVFAKGYENYSGIGAGFGFSWAKISGGEPDGAIWKASEIAISVTDYGFLEKSPVGLFVDASLYIIPHRMIRIFVIPDYELDTLVGFSGTIGPAFKFDLSKKLDLLLGVGFQVYAENREYGDIRSRTTLYGVGLNAEASYELNDNFALTAGIASSMYFSHKIKVLNDGSVTKFDPFFEIRVIPKVAIYYVY